MLLPIDHGNSVDVVILIVVSILVPPHNQFLFGSLQANGANWLVSFRTNIDVSHSLASIPDLVLSIVPLVDSSTGNIQVSL